MLASRIAVGFIGATVLVASLVGAPSAHAANASPSTLSFDCDLVNGVSASTITGEVGDTFVIENVASGAGACSFGSMTGIVSATNLTAGALAAGSSSTVTIVSEGTFTIEANGGVAVTMTVVIGRPVAVPEYTISFDANGGSCPSTGSSVSGPLTDWYVMPSADACSRLGYELMGWARTPSASSAEYPAGSPGQFVDHETLYAVWRPEGVEITFDANVGSEQTCVDSSGAIVAPAQQSTVLLWERNEVLELPRQAPCTPVGHVLLGWSESGSGPVLFAPGESEETVNLPPGSALTMYAIWRPEYSLVLAEGVSATSNGLCTATDRVIQVPLTLQPMNVIAKEMHSEIASDPDLRSASARVSIACNSGNGPPLTRIAVTATLFDEELTTVQGLSPQTPTGAESFSLTWPKVTGSLRAMSVFALQDSSVPSYVFNTQAPQSVSVSLDGRITVPEWMGDAVFQVKGSTEFALQ